MVEPKIKYAVIAIPTDPTSGEKVRIYFVDENGKEHEGEEKRVEQWPIKVDPEYIKGDRLFIDHAMWHISNPTCVTWDGRRV